MKNIKIEAIRIFQPGVDTDNGRAIYAGAIKIKDLIDENEFTIDYWQHGKKDADDQGYQRTPKPAHFKAIGKYAVENDAIFPGAILLSCRNKQNKVSFEKIKGNAGILTLENPPFWIIDGQHRTKGLKYAIEELKDEKWAEKELPVVILANFTRIEEIKQFNVINSTQKKVDTGLAQQLLLLRAMRDPEEHAQIVERNQHWKLQSLRMIELLNERSDSPWHGRIRFPNEEKSVRHIVNQNSFLVSLKPLYQNFFAYTRSLDKEYEILRNYWLALKEIFPGSFANPDESVIQKTPGIFSLHELAQAILQSLPHISGSDNEYSVASFKKILKDVFGKEYGDNYWQSDSLDGAALYGSMKGFRILANKFIDSLGKLRK